MRQVHAIELLDGRTTWNFALRTTCFWTPAYKKFTCIRLPISVYTYRLPPKAREERGSTTMMDVTKARHIAELLVDARALARSLGDETLTYFIEMSLAHLVETQDKTIEAAERRASIVVHESKNPKASPSS
jgi:hypothetical protein